MMTLDLESSIRLPSDSAEKPPKTTECTAPILAQASCSAGRNTAQIPHTLPHGIISRKKIKVVLENTQRRFLTRFRMV
jgi:hypothetical protein